MYQIGDQIEIIAGEFAGLGGTVTAVFSDDCYEVLVGGYLLPVAAPDLAPDLHMAATRALAELQRLQGDSQVIALLMAALRR